MRGHWSIPLVAKGQRFIFYFHLMWHLFCSPYLTKARKQFVKTPVNERGAEVG